MSKLTCHNNFIFQASYPYAELSRDNEGLRIVGPEGSPAFKCPVCNGFYVNKMFFNRHLQEHEEESLKQEKAGSKKAKRSKEMTAENQSPCNKPVVKITKCKQNSGMEQNPYKQSTESIVSSSHHESASDVSSSKDLLVADCGRLKLLNVKTYTCTACGKSFSRKNHVIRHFRKTHRKPKHLICLVCDRGFSRARLLQQHMQKHRKKRSSDAKPFLCAECGRSFSNEHLLVRHSVVHSKTARFSCEKCGKEFNYRYKLRLHEQSHQRALLKKRELISVKKVRPQSTNADLTCPICCKTLSSRMHLEHHRFVHAEEKPYLCDVCQKRFTRKGTLRFHMRIHKEGYKEFKCDVCEKVLKKESTLKSHMSVHKNSDTSNKFLCKFCGKGFLKITSLRNHYQLHKHGKRFTCKYCGKCFTQKQHHKLHEDVVHNGIKRHICSVCSKAFSTNRNLIEHELNHNPLAQYLTCSVCMQTFGIKYQLARHLKSHHLDTTGSSNLAGISVV